MTVRRLVIPGPAGPLDTRVHGDGPPVLVLHPHPLHGGTKGTRLVYRLAEALAEAGFAAWRFDFRGVGGSTGSYGNGSGEVADSLSVWDAARAAAGQGPVVVGFSFGGGVAARLAVARPVPRLVLVATPATVGDSDLCPVDDLPRVRCPVHVVWGTADGHVPRADVEALHAARPDLSVHVLEGADHFLTPAHHDRAVRAVLDALDGLHA